MEIIVSIAGAVWSVLSIVLAGLWWIVSYLLWGMLWLFLPLVLASFVAVRVAEKAFGREAVRAWVQARTMRFGAGTWERVRPWLFALGAAPFRVLVWFIMYVVWHALVSVFWSPRWTPWQRAWGKRWKKAADPRRPVAKGAGIWKTRTCDASAAPTKRHRCYPYQERMTRSKSC